MTNRAAPAADQAKSAAPQLRPLDKLKVRANKAAMDRYGISVSDGRIVLSGRPIHLALERALTDVYRADDVIAPGIVGLMPPSYFLR